MRIPKVAAMKVYLVGFLCVFFANGLLGASSEPVRLFVKEVPLKVLGREVPGESFRYDFPLKQGGTYWMHSHYGFQEQLLLSAPLIIRDGGEKSGEQDIILELADFSFTPPEKIFADLQRAGPPKWTCRALQWRP